MRKCFDFTTGANGQMHQVADVKAIFDLCQQRRDEGKTGFIVRAETRKEAGQRLRCLSANNRATETVFIL